ncbi:unnamed protein product [Leptosia nina]|uniref:Secreted protein n=1 Tax=Leptosia nina TaxID=320188 RepID=A0AAV1J5L8_9NEOP
MILTILVLSFATSGMHPSPVNTVYLMKAQGAGNQAVKGVDWKNASTTNGGCCFGQICTNPCVIPVPLYQPQMPIVLPARTVYEPVEHDHPPLGEIRDIITADKQRYASSESSDTSDTETDYDYYESFIGKIS